MAFDLNAIGGYGNGELGDVTDPAGAISPTCVYQATTNGTDSQIGLEHLSGNATMAAGDDFGDWTVGSKILLVSAEESSGGKWAVRTITACSWRSVTGGEYVLDLTLNAPPNIHDTTVIGFAVKIAQYKNLTLNSGCSVTAAASPSTIDGYTGGFVALMCSETLTFNGGHIDLRGNFGRGYSSLTTLEQNGKLDTDKYSGWENSQTKDRLLLSNGDGAAFIIAKEITVTSSATTSRIGNPSTQGVQYCRGASDSYDRPSGVTNLGGSTILMVAGTFTKFAPRLIAKYRTGTDDANAGKGLGRCYIASGTKLTNDEGLYAYDNISNPAVVTDTLKIKNFGDGSTGDWTISQQSTFNSYAAVTAFSKNRKVLTVKNMTTDGIARFAVGALVMVHAKGKGTANVTYTGRFYLARILDITGNDITLDTAAPYNTFNNWLSTYYVQIVAIPQFNTLTYRETHSVNRSQVWDSTKGYGGIIAIAASNTCDLRNSRLFLLDGRAANPSAGNAEYGASGLKHIGNAQDYNILPIGQGHASIFILAKNLTMNSSTRIGAMHSGATGAADSWVNPDYADHFGGTGGHPQSSRNGVYSAAGGGYRGHTAATTIYAYHGLGGHGGGGGIAKQPRSDETYTGGKGGYGSNGYEYGFPSKNSPFSTQGAHIMIIADTITGFNQAAISTGGIGGCPDTTQADMIGEHVYGLGGSAGYGGGGGATHKCGSIQPGFGGGGGYNGGGGGGKCGPEVSEGQGGGGSGWAFIYCNNAVNQDTTDTVID